MSDTRNRKLYIRQRITHLIEFLENLKLAKFVYTFQNTRTVNLQHLDEQIEDIGIDLCHLILIYKNHNPCW